MQLPSLERIEFNNELYALILRKDYESTGIQFFTPDAFSHQLGYMNRPKGYVIDPHFHVVHERTVQYTHEVLFVRKGRVRVDFYGPDQVYLDHREITTGDVILLAHGGHGFEMLEESEMIEVKQGPYAGDQDKVRFTPDRRAK